MKVFRPTYVSEFKCDGKACGSRCCRDWRIFIDEETRRKYLQLPAADREEIFCRVDESAQVFKLQSSGACPFLDENFLCRLQLKHGEEFLTAVCQSFPRVTYRLGEEIFLQAMTLTCPVAAILILLRDRIVFELAEELKARQIFDFTERISSAEKFLDRQQTAIKILQRRDLSINRRLEKLCVFFGEKTSGATEFNEKNHAAALAEIFAEMYDADSTVAKRNQLAEIYRTNRRNILAQLYENFSTVLENYLVNEFVMRCYPCAFKGDEAFNIRVFVTTYRAVEFAAVLTVVSKGRLTVEDFLELICALSDKLDHGSGGMTAIKNFTVRHDTEAFYSVMIDRGD